ncbi:raffinose/stachyose/melibiose transport system substrate-binding protein [Hydrogenispora ethanolica]|uniref:Raffinose/stachyose/melibiose transport system substrate-binding protein n=1 Tax=Hydrogenispora ethanolica TaxID=1082276 RepID=A0A4R1R9Z7_HYDET|nr:ABC transporter substrate-binding protein [Hydrogenispora ethanolica]TCL62553.1 raffinose/stachyose/melibiose transport system substrate-binding protein [Hydrogenispora ethanolica]
MKKFLGMIMLIAILAMAVVTHGAPKKVEISFLVTKPEIVTQFRKTFDAYSATHPNVTISTIPLSGQTIYEKLTSLYASGNAPTITMVGGPEFTAFKDKFLDVTNTKFGKAAYDWSVRRTTMNGKIYAVPTTAEGIGIMYNKTVIEAATGKKFDPASIKSRKDLRELLQKIAKTKYAPVQLSNMDWLLGSHMTSILYAAMSKDYDERQKILLQCAKGKFDFMRNDTFNGWMDTFDLLMTYNMHKGAPLGNTYEDDQLAMAKDKVAFWVIGNYVYPNIVGMNPDAKVGMMPYPISDNQADYGNSQITLTHSFFAIDGAQSSKSEQAAAIDFFNWLLTSAKGQKHYIDTLIFTPVYKGFSIQPSNPVAKEIVSYMKKGKTLERMSDYFPAGITVKFGAAMQRYMDGVGTRKDVADSFKKDWLEMSSK